MTDWTMERVIDEAFSRAAVRIREVRKELVVARERAEELESTRELLEQLVCELADALGCRPDNEEMLNAACRMREALAFYANPNVYRSHPHGSAFDRRDLTFVARDALPRAEEGMSP